MNAIASLLSESYSDRVRRLWDEIERRFGLSQMRQMPHPHFSYHLTTAEDVPSILGQLKGKLASFSVRTSGLGIFTAQQPITFINVVRSPQLNTAHQIITEHFPEGIETYYQPQQWMPHITLSGRDTTHAILAEMIPWLATQNFYWRFEVDNLVYLDHATGTIEARVDF